MKKSKVAGINGKVKERVRSQSAAEFFSEHQQIAGFDNPGKSLFTTIRELVENSLDAAESLGVLPEIIVNITEFGEDEHNIKHGIKIGNQLQSSSFAADPTITTESTTPGKSTSKTKDSMYYEVQCIDNGCGISHNTIGVMLGKVLSGSKQGVRQTRGKFGLGAKMALIWSKKSSGLPIKIKTAHTTSSENIPSHVSHVTLDIDIAKNEPKLLESRTSHNTTNWRGLDLTVTVLGNWSNYRSRVLQYFQQLAVITPYADLQLNFNCNRDPKKSFRVNFVRRSEQMPNPPLSVLPHPKSLNNITLSRMLKECKSKNLALFLTKELTGINAKSASAISSSLGLDDEDISEMTTSQIAALCQVLRDDKTIKPPSAKCLSPAGEYNLRLGVLKELQPRLLATSSDKPGSFDGHPFIVEAAVSLGGTKVREGINIFRFANRIPLLFETGADVVTQVATKKINWSSYLIDSKKDSIGVYVSIVSTKIPFKGTSKEYIGEDVTEVQQSVRRALITCCQQLRAQLSETLALKEAEERRKNFQRYIPDIASALTIVVQNVAAKKAKLNNVQYNSLSQWKVNETLSLFEEESRDLVESGTKKKKELSKNNASSVIFSNKILEKRLFETIDNLNQENELQKQLNANNAKRSYSLKELSYLQNDNEDFQMNNFNPLPEWFMITGSTLRCKISITGGSLSR